MPSEPLQPLDSDADQIETCFLDVVAWIRRHNSLRDPAVDAEDVAQDTFIRVMQGSMPAKDVRVFRRHVFQVVGNQVIDERRRSSAQKRGGGKTASLDELLQSGWAPIGSDPFVERAERREQLEVAFASLNDRTRDLLWLYAEGRSVPEILKVLRREDSAAARMRVHRSIQRALRLMRRRIGILPCSPAQVGNRIPCHG